MKIPIKGLSFTILLSISSAIYSMEYQATKKNNQLKLMEMASAYILSRAIHTAAEIKVADYMVTGSQNVVFLAQKTGMNENALYRLLRLLASYDIFSHDESNNFSLTSLAQELVSTDPFSLWAWTTYHNDSNRWAAFNDMKYSIETGKPAFDHLFGKGYFDHLSEYPLLGKQFDEGMKNLSEGENTLIATSYDFSSYPLIVDIGGGKGGLISEIIRNNKTQKGILFDLPYVAQSANEYLTQSGLLHRIDFVKSEGFFEVPGGADLYMLKRILHDWNDEQCVTILKNCYKVMKNNTRLLIIENIVSQENVRDFSKDIDIAMMVLFGGKERAHTEWLTLLEKADLECIAIHKTSAIISIIEIQKKQ